MGIRVSAILTLSDLVLFQMPLAYGADEVHDEIQVYNAEIAAIGQWTYEQHLNYAGIGQTVPEVPGGFHSNRALQGTPEFAYGLTEWWEAGFYLPFAVNGDSQFLSDGAKIRSLFVVPDAAKRSFFYGVNFELGYELPRFSATPWNLEIRPIIGVRNSEWEFIVNPIIDIGFGSAGEADFAPAAQTCPQPRPGQVHWSRILFRLRQNRRLPASSKAKPTAVCRHRLQAGQMGRRAWCGLRVHDGLRSIRSQSNSWLRIPRAR